MHTCVCVSVLSCLLGHGVDLLGHMVILGLTVGGTCTVFHSGCPGSHSQQQCVRFQSPRILAGIFIQAALLNVESCLIVALICIS